MTGVNVKSEIKPLKKVLLHRPGKELLNLTPNTLEELLFDDIPFLKVAQAEHDAFAQALRNEGVEVFYLEDLTAEVLAADPAPKRPASAPSATRRSSSTTCRRTTPTPRTSS